MWYYEPYAYGLDGFEKVPISHKKSLITGEGHGHYRRGGDKCESYHKHKKKTSRKMAQKSRRQNRR